MSGLLLRARTGAGLLGWMVVWAWWSVWPAAGARAAVDPVAVRSVPLHGEVLHQLDEACVLLGARGADGVPPPDGPWLHTHLPHRWMDTHPGHTGSMWYRFRVDLAGVPKGPWAVYLPRVSMNGQVWINGVALPFSGSMTEPVTRNWYVPLLFTVPSTLWRDGANVIDVRVASGHAAREGLAPIAVGPLEQVMQPYRWRRWIQVDLMNFIHTALITSGLLMGLGWWRDRSQGAVAYMGLAAFTWGLSTLLMIRPEPLSDPSFWEGLRSTLTHWYQLALCAFFFRIADCPPRSLARVFGALMVLVAGYHATAADFVRTGYVYGATYLIALVGMGLAISHVIRTRRPDGGWLVLGCAALVPAAFHDMLIVTGALPFDSVYLMGIFGPVLIACNFVVLAGDQGRSRAALHELNRTLATRVAEREAALRDSFARLSALEKAQAATAERARIVQDMHDGVGAHLTSALRQLQAPGARPPDIGLVTQTLRDSLAQLKLTIDAMSLASGDVAGLLASWRYRLAPRLEAAGIALRWDVAPLPTWPDGSPPALRQLQYILYEALSNVLQHAHATQLVLAAHALPDAIEVTLTDNGCGWDPGVAPRGQGIVGMLGRASQIGVALHFDTPRHGGLAVRLVLPLAATAAHPGPAVGISSST